MTSGGIPAEGEFKAGDVVDGTYEIISLIGSGGMGNVYKARHNMMNQEYALKTLELRASQRNSLASFSKRSPGHRPHESRQRRRHLQSRLARRPLTFLCNGFAQRPNPSRHFAQSKNLGVEQALTLFSEVAAGIGYAHKKGIVHRDLKPGNIVIMESSDNTGSCIKIVDFGIAKLSGLKDQRNQELTNVGEICGSPYYMSPEQCAGGRVDTRSDVYSFGCTLFEALTGNPPYKGRTVRSKRCSCTKMRRCRHCNQATGKKFPLHARAGHCDHAGQSADGSLPKDGAYHPGFFGHSRRPRSAYQSIHYLFAQKARIANGSPRSHRCEAQEALALIEASTRPNRLKIAATVGLTVSRYRLQQL